MDRTSMRVSDRACMMRLSVGCRILAGTWRHVSVTLILAIGVLGSVQSVEAQTLRGRILDSVTRDPVMLAYVGLITEGQSMAVATLADTNGTFEVTAPDPGEYVLYISRTGYEPLMDGVFELGEGGVFDVQIGLRPMPVELEEMVVEAESGPMSFLERNGFYDRAIGRGGVFMIREDIERLAVDRVTDVFRQIPLLDIDESRPLTGGPDVFQNPEIRVIRNGQYCSPTLYIDRHMVDSGALGGVRPDDYITAMEIDAIEVYTRFSQTPVGFDDVNNCGVILIWTRTR